MDLYAHGRNIKSLKLFRSYLEKDKIKNCKGSLTHSFKTNINYSKHKLVFIVSNKLDLVYTIY